MQRSISANVFYQIMVLSTLTRTRGGLNSTLTSLPKQCHPRALLPYPSLLEMIPNNLNKVISKIYTYPSSLLRKCLGAMPISDEYDILNELSVE